MPVDLVVPSLGESVASVVIVEWKKAIGQAVSAREDVVEVESDKATQNIPSSVNGVLIEILKNPGDAANVGDVIARIDEKATASAAPAAPAATPSASPATGESRVMPAAARVMAEQQLTPSQVTATGPGGRILKEDAEKAASAKPAPAPVNPPALVPPSAAPATKTVIRAVGDRITRRQTMSPIRKRIAQRLMDAQHSAALLTTFNEIDMTDVMALRKQHQDAFVERHGVKLGFMSFFVKAAIDALQATPQLNAEIQGNDIVYHDYCDIGIAIGGGKGLVVPILRNAEAMTFAEIEKSIGDFGNRAKTNSLSPSELQGGTFTISNGGVYGSLLSTPIVNPPQSGVLGMHTIQERPVVRNGQIVIRSMMYIALTYDHRIVDGREAVAFLKRIKDCIENPLRLMLEV